MNGYQLDWWAVLSGQPREWLLSGIWMTFRLTVFSSLLATVIAVILLAMRLTTSRLLQGIAASYITVFRNTPLAVQFLFWYFGVIPLLPEVWRDWLNETHNYAGFTFPSMELIAGIWGLGLFSAAFIAEELRAGVRAVSAGQFEAARSQGLSAWQTLRYVILPQALANSWQPLIGQYLNLMKNSTLAMSIAVAELCYQVNQIESYNLHAIEAFAVGSLIYLLLGLFLSSSLEAFGRVIFKHKRSHSRG